MGARVAAGLWLAVLRGYIYENNKFFQLFSKALLVLVLGQAAFCFCRR